MTAPTPRPRPAPVLQRLLGWGLLTLTAGALGWEAAATERVELSLGSLAGDQWRVEGALLTLTLGSDALAVELRAERVQLAFAGQVLEDLRLHCPALQPLGGGWECPGATLSAVHARLPADPVAASFRYDPASASAYARLDQVPLFGGSVDVTVEGQGGQWRVQASLREVRLAQVAEWLPTQLPPGFSLDGRASGPLAAQVDADGLRALTWKPVVEALAFSDAEGLNAAEGVALEADLQLGRISGGWRSDGRLAFAHGTVCIAGPCWELPYIPAQVHWQGAWHDERLHLEALRFSDEAGNTLEGSLTLAPGAPQPVSAADLGLTSPALGTLYERYLQPVLIGTLADSLDVAGRLEGHLRYGAGGLAVDGRLEELALRDRAGRFALWGLGGTLRWSSRAEPVASELHWDGGRLYDVALGSTRLALQSTPEQVLLSAPASLPVFDGSLEVDTFVLTNPLGPFPAWQLAAVLTPLSMEDFSAALGWPVMSGRLSGVIPTLRYAYGTMEVDGVLLVRAFDGEITVQNLRVERLLGVAPTLTADVRLRALDLRELTSTFSFGRIEGRLEGSVDDLVLQNWRPVAFTADLHTPPGDRSRRRISQRAVENLTTLGGGMAGALSQSVLRVFDEFSYSRLGINCHLEDGVCRMGGVAPAPQGYYIVEGGGLPRIDVIGHERRVDWEVLLERLQAVTAAEAPIVR